MNNSLKQKQQIEQDQEKLILHIEAKLQELRNQRKKLEESDFKEIPQQNIQKQKFVNEPKILKQANSNSILTKKSLSNTDYLYQKRHQKEVKQNLKNLQQLYNKKKQLQAIGVIPISMDQVDKLYSDPKNKKKMAEYDPQAKQKKDQILKEQMQRIQYMLKKKKVTKKQISEMKEFYYTNLMKDKLQKLERYQQILIYNKKGIKLSLIEKEELIDIVFDTLKDFDQTIKKTLVKDFLLANQKFCSVFYITQEEIFNDLEVYQTQIEGQLTRNQFYQFIKSIEISNPALNPSLKRTVVLQQRQKKASVKSVVNDSKVSKKSANSKQIQDQRKKKTEMIAYLKRLFQYFDQKQQGLIQRDRFLIALKKGLLLDTKKVTLLKKEHLQKFADYLQKLRQNKNQKSYYMKLQSKFLAWSEIDEFYSNFVKGQKINKVQKNLSEFQKDDDTQSKQSDNFSEFAQHNKEKQPTYVPEIIRKGNLEQYFEQYGWKEDNESAQQKVFASQLNEFDKYYKDLRQKHGNQIEWNNDIRYRLSLANNVEFKNDFNKLESYIKAFQKKE